MKESGFQNLIHALFVWPLCARGNQCPCRLPAVIQPSHFAAKGSQGSLSSACAAIAAACVATMVLREFGFAIPLGVNVAKDRIGTALNDLESGLPTALRATLAQMLQEIRLLDEKILGIEHQLNALTRDDVRVQQLRQIPGIGALTSTALRAIVGDIQRFPSGRHFASWLGLTPNERSSAEKRRLGKISKQGDVYLRTLIVHGARSALLGAHRAERSGHTLDHLRRWALDCERQRGHNKATVALANRLARIVWATWKHERPFDGNWSATDS